MLALIPWLRSRPEGVPVEEVCARFGVDRSRLLADIAALSRVGVEPYLPGDVIDVVVEGGRVFAYIPLSFTRPLRITPPQALSLIASGAGLLAASGGLPDEPLRRALDKLAHTLGIDVDDAISVQLGPADARHLGMLRGAIAERRQVDLDYYSAGRDDRTTRTVDPFQVVSMGGHWYLSGWCHTAEGDRLFRVDRIASVTLRDEAADIHADREPLSPLHYDEHTPRVTLIFAASAAWVTETFATDEAEVLADGGVRVVVPVASDRWLIRLLLQLGDEVAVVADHDGVAAGLADAAAHVAARYRRAGGTSLPGRTSP